VAALEVFRASLPRRGDKGRDDRLFLEAMHYVSVHNISWRALPERFGKWNSVWKRFALRCEKTKRYFASIVALTAGFILVKSVHTA
jgi:transposase